MNNMDNNNKQLTAAFTISVIAISITVCLTLALSVYLRLDFSNSPTRPNVRIAMAALYSVSFVLGIVGLSVLKTVDRSQTINKAYFIMARVFSIVSIVGSVLYFMAFTVLYFIIEFLYLMIPSRDNHESSSSSLTSLIQIIIPYLP